jgi:hypothetical protein
MGAVEKKMEPDHRSVAWERGRRRGAFTESRSINAGIASFAKRSCNSNLYNWDHRGSLVTLSRASCSLMRSLWRSCSSFVRSFSACFKSIKLRRNSS